MFCPAASSASVPSDSWPTAVEPNSYPSVSICYFDNPQPHAPAFTVSPRRQHLGLYYQLYFDNIGQDEVCLFLRELLRNLRGSVIVLLDNSSTRQGAPLQQLLRQHSRLHIEHFPSYAPELNPDEGVWSLAKRALANSCPNDVEELVEDVIGSINRIRVSTQKLRGCILQSGLL